MSLSYSVIFTKHCLVLTISTAMAYSTETWKVRIPIIIWELSDFYFFRCQCSGGHVWPPPEDSWLWGGGQDDEQVHCAWRIPGSTPGHHCLHGSWGQLSVSLLPKKWSYLLFVPFVQPLLVKMRICPGASRGQLWEKLRHLESRLSDHRDGNGEASVGSVWRFQPPRANIQGKPKQHFTKVGLSGN